MNVEIDPASVGFPLRELGAYRHIPGKPTGAAHKATSAMCPFPPFAILDDGIAFTEAPSSVQTLISRSDGLLAKTCPS